ncbi:MAG: hypothetical protein AB1758_07630 [Candidatus Eremiobacterota bacterium]
MIGQGVGIHWEDLDEDPPRVACSSPPEPRSLNRL